MRSELTIRETAEADVQDIYALYLSAFPDENLIPLVTALVHLPAKAMNFFAFEQDELVGHVCFCACAISGSPAKLALLGPLAVLPSFQKQGIGAALVSHGLTRLKEGDHQMLLVFGDPDYYGRFGFEVEKNIMPPHPIDEAWRFGWQSKKLVDTEVKITGKLEVPPPWDQAELWQM